ncbi:YqgE/AlgH family protein [Paracoccus sp. p4-l81]
MEPMDLTGQILIAMPGMGDARFEHAVVLIAAHGAKGAMGLIVNKPIPDLGFLPLLKQLQIETGPATRRLAVHYGGPVDTQRGFVLHDDPEGLAADPGSPVMAAGPGLAITTSRDILADLAQGGGPDRVMLALGYAGWGAGQLESEIARNGWLTGSADPDLIFAPQPGRVWSASLRAQGIDPLALSSDAGRA